MAVLTTATTALLLPAAMASAATSSSPKGPPLSNTTQTLGTQPDGAGGYSQSVEIDFTKKTFTIPSYDDKGTFKSKGMTVTLKITKGPDKSCTFPGTYDATTSEYEGTYTCKDGASEGFALSTDGSGPG